MIPGEESILQRAYIPEHIVSLMTLISKAEALLINDHLVYVKANWAILVGYPLDGNFSADRLKSLAADLKAGRDLQYLWVIAPAIPDDLFGTPTEKEDDDYYRLDLAGFEIKASAKRAAKKARSNLVVGIAGEISKEHGVLIREFLRRENPKAIIRELYMSMGEYVNQSATAHILEARDHAGHLSAFFVIDSAAAKFDLYVLGCHSKKHYVPYASDLLFARMISLAQERKKEFINLGLGVNSGIRRFKEKWGGVPFLRYEFREYQFGQRRSFSIFDALRTKF